jgi:hypothetical protein
MWIIEEPSYKLEGIFQCEEVIGMSDGIDFIEEHDGQHHGLGGGEGVSGAIGLDIGTANVVMAHQSGGEVMTRRELNAFFTIPYSNITKGALAKNNTFNFQKNNQFYVLGDAAENFATMLGGITRRTIEKGILNAKEDDGIDVVKSIVNSILDGTRGAERKVCFTVPGNPMDSPASVVFHESVIKKHLESLGYSAISINEGLAVIFSELEADNFTGIGISLGGGMCNVCFSYLSVPVVAFSIQKGGDYIDEMVGSSVNESPTRIKRIKEEGLDLLADPKDRIETGLHIYYDDLFETLASSLHRVLGSSDNIPRITGKIPVVLSGGTVMPNGSLEKFKKAMASIRLPFEISDVQLADEPLYSTAKGAFKMALAEM